VTIEWIERRGAGAVDWRYRQDRDALFYFEQEVVACRGVLDGSRISRPLSGTSWGAEMAQPRIRIVLQILLEGGREAGFADPQFANNEDRASFAGPNLLPAAPE
jgi:hypothetical protein